jgi:hypothetical protein
VSKVGPALKDTSHIDIKVSLKKFEEMIPAEELTRLDHQGSIN